VAAQSWVAGRDVVEPFLAAPGDVDGRAHRVKAAGGGQPDAGRPAHD
jgi:hypothetical protein